MPLSSCFVCVRISSLSSFASRRRDAETRSERVIYTYSIEIPVALSYLIGRVSYFESFQPLTSIKTDHISRSQIILEHKINHTHLLAFTCLVAGDGPFSSNNVQVRYAPLSLSFSLSLSLTCGARGALNKNTVSSCRRRMFILGGESRGRRRARVTARRGWWVVGLIRAIEGR